MCDQSRPEAESPKELDWLRKRILELEQYRKLKTIADKAGHGVAMSDLEGNLTYVNESFAQMHGYSPEELVGLHLSIFHNQEQLERVNELNQRLVQEGSYTSEEVWHTRKDNTIFPALMSATVIGDEKGKPLFLAATATDITERKKAEEALRTSEEKYRSLVESAGEAIATIDLKGVCTFMNETAAKRLGGAPRDFIGKTMWDLFPKDIANSQGASVQEVIKTGRPMNVIVPTRLGESLRWYSTTIQTLKDGEGEVAAAMVIARDIHELVQAQEEVRVLSSAVGQSIDGIAMGDMESRIVYVNEAFAHMHGYSRQEMVGMMSANLYAKDQMDRFERIVAQVRAEGSSTGEMMHIRKDGTSFPCYLSVTLMRNGRGEATGTVVVCKNMTESRQKEAELTKFRAQMARAEQLASLGTLSATVAHQITQPLNCSASTVE